MYTTDKEESSMIITATELKANVGRYLRHASTERIHVTRNGKVIATISNPAMDRQSTLDGLVGIATANPLTLEQAKEGRLSER
jgi:antitoxin (DNA-binding transcriptional repressor) of toxin-antitoxin stability system